MAYQAEVRRVSGATGIHAMEPGSMIVRGRSGRLAELKVDNLSGGYMLHLALAACCYGNMQRFARQKGIELSNASVVVDGGFNEEGTASTGMACQMMIEGDAPREGLIAIAQEAFDESSIAAILRQTTTVHLTGINAHSTAQSG